MLAGVAGGIADTYGFDPALVRLGFVVLALATFGTGVIAYVVAWLVVPEADADEPVLTSAVRDARQRRHDGRLWIGVGLVLVGAATLAGRFAFGGFSRVFWRLPRVRRRRERSMLGRFTWSAVLIVAGVAWLIDITGAAVVDARFVFAIELALVGIALLVGAFFGRSRGLIALGLVLTFFAGTFAALDVPLHGPIGERVVHPATIGALEGKYHIGIGHLQVDLRDTTLDGETHRVVLTDAIGFIEVFVPTDARVEVKARSDIGSVDILGRPEEGGTHADLDVVDDPAGSSGPRIVIDAHVGFGAVKVARAQPDRAGTALGVAT
jgi:phage shock protein PspC (stress-responsive transcriptional regulator)